MLGESNQSGLQIIHLESSKYIFLSAQKKANLEDPLPEDIYIEGTIAKIIQILKLPNGLNENFSRWCNSR